ncbi:MAG TPA: GH3 auxin-responsive promoter family protein [Burkholderiales bacterium]|nr:GH3 auxin-responsive promoter family protein [Burkholderiales bacterium]
MSRTSASLAHLWYPLFVGGAIAAYALMLRAGFGTATAAYLPVLALGIVILLLEWRFPERLDWRAQRPDLAADALFMAVVQVALPQLLTLAALLFLADWFHQRAPSAWWPHGWPLAAQAITMVLAVDFVRYWLHRACHRFDLLWRLHEVHHSPDILYVLNVGRFHPLEKALHFSVDTVPFLLLGVAPEVLASYFLLYSANGLFQHSNVRLRYGWLNYVVGSAETHRWHHARDPKTAMCNFSNTTIVWDLVFGTWQLPGPVGEIGIVDRGYPKDFWSQMVTPFGSRDGRRPTLSARCTDSLIALRLTLTRVFAGPRLMRAARNPMREQRRLLARIVRENRQTAFGRRHGFERIAGYEDYARQVPIAEFEALRPYIEAQIGRGERALTEEAPIAYVRTSGTTGKPKDIPLIASHLKALRRIHRIAVAFQHRTCPEAFRGGVLVIVSPAVEGMLSNGHSYGSASGIVAGDTPRPVRKKFVVPPEVLTVADSRLKYLLILRLALSRRDVAYVGTANATTLLALINLYREHAALLNEDLRRGTFFLMESVPADVQRAIAGRLTADAARADRLVRLEAGCGARLADLLPALRLVVTWTCASAGIAVEALRRELGPRTRILELGYLSSEFRGTLTLGKRAGSGLPTLDTHFFEFVERDTWDRGEREFLTLDRLEKSRDYYIIVTTPSGLYRYFINDLVRVTGFLHATPLLKFLQKGKGVTSITGEKVYESQVLAAVREVLSGAGLEARYVMMLADEQTRRYRLYVEGVSLSKPDVATFASRVDEALQRLNIEYRAKRESGRLEAPTAAWLAPGTGEAFKRFSVERGQREGQFKAMALAYRRDFAFDLDSYVEAH